jgi:hypothetical protein
MPLPIKPTSFISTPIADIEFPEHSIVGAAKDYVDLCASVRETPRPFLWAAYATYLGSMVSPYTKIKDIPTSEPRLFTAVLGKSSWARKSSGNNLTESFFHDVGACFGGTGGLPSPQRTIDGFGSSEGLLKNLKGATPTVLLLDELDVLAKKTTADGSVGISALNTLFEKHKFEYNLSRGNCKAEGVHLSLLAASTIDSFLSTWSGEHSDAGFFSRLFILSAESQRTHPFPQEPPEEKWEAMKIQTVEIVQAAREGKFSELDWAEGAKQNWVRFYRSCGEGSEWNRLDTYGLRLISLQCALKSESEISKATVDEVVCILKYEADMRREFKPVVSETVEGKVQQRIVSALAAGPLTHRELYRKVHAERFGTRVFKAAMEGLIDNDTVAGSDSVWQGKVRYSLSETFSGVVYSAPKCPQSRGGQVSNSKQVN